MALPPLSSESFDDAVKELGEQVKAKLYDIIVIQDIKGPFQSQLQAAFGMSQVIGTLRTKIEGQQPQEPLNQSGACKMLMQVTASEVLKIVPSQVEVLLTLIKRA